MLDGAPVPRAACDGDESPAHPREAIAPLEVAREGIEAEDLSVRGGEDFVPILVDVDEIAGKEVSNPLGFTGETIEAEHAALHADVDWFHAAHSSIGDGEPQL